MITRLGIIVLAVALATGCATAPTGENYVPMVDFKDGQRETFSADLSACQAYAAQTAGAGQSAVAGAIAGALLGVVLGAIAGGGIRNEMAGIGAVSGAVSGAGTGEMSQRAIISRCLSGRGYSVLN